MPTGALSDCGTPPIAASARTWASIQSGSACVQLACAKVKLEAPSTATKICAMRISPVLGQKRPRYMAKTFFSTLRPHAR